MYVMLYVLCLPGVPQRENDACCQNNLRISKETKWEHSQMTCILKGNQNKLLRSENVM